MAKKISSDDLTYVPDLEAAARRRGHPFAIMLSIIVFIFFICAIYWADNAILDEVTRGQGQVIPSSRVQVIQNLEGGIVAEVLVNEGQIVEPGDILVRIDNIAARSDYREDKRRYLATLAQAARLEAELKQEPPVFPDEVVKEDPRMVIEQTKLYHARRKQISSQIRVLKTQAEQRRQEIAEMLSRKKQLEVNLKLAIEQRDIAKPLMVRKIYPRVDYIRLERDVQDLSGTLQTLKLSIPRARTALRESQEKVEAFIDEGRAEISAELNTRLVEIQALQEMITAGEDRVTRTEVRSPVRGTVKQVYHNTVGGVLRPGEDIMEIVPLDDTLLIEANIRPADIAFIRPGQEATVKLTAYDFSIYGGLKARVEQISADTIKDEEGESFYHIRLRTKENKLVHNGAELPIIPGMVASADILTGKKTVLDYLLKPILKARQRAMRER
jgi:adhesin transport system membrane fusion protein